MSPAPSGIAARRVHPLRHASLGYAKKSARRPTSSDIARTLVVCHTRADLRKHPREDFPFEFPLVHPHDVTNRTIALPTVAEPEPIARTTAPLGDGIGSTDAAGPTAASGIRRLGKLRVARRAVHQLARREPRAENRLTTNRRRGSVRGISPDSNFEMSSSAPMPK